MDKKILAVVNPTAGAGKTLKIWPKKSKLFKQEFSNFREKYTNQPGDAVEIAKKAVEENYDYIIAVGGDGTVNEIINGMLKVSTNFVKTKLLIYPLGTGSDLSRVLNLPDQDKGFLELIYRGKSRNISAVEAKFINHEKKEKRYFINIADCGMGAEVAKKLNKSQKIATGSLSYLIKIFQTLINYQNKKVKIEADNKLIYQGKINTVIIAHGNYFGGGIKIAPEADLYSEKLNLVLLKNFSKLGIILNLIKGYKGNHLSHSLVETYFAEEITISSEEKIEIELDGESVGICNASFKISKKKVPILI